MTDTENDYPQKELYSPVQHREGRKKDIIKKI